MSDSAETSDIKTHLVKLVIAAMFAGYLGLFGTQAAILYELSKRGQWMDEQNRSAVANQELDDRVSKNISLLAQTQRLLEYRITKAEEEIEDLREGE